MGFKFSQSWSELPIILTGSEDGSLRIWHANTYRLENTLSYNMERVWCVNALKGRYVMTDVSWLFLGLNDMKNISKI